MLSDWQLNEGQPETARMTNVDPRIPVAVREIVSHLVAARYAQLETETCSKRLTAAEIESEIVDYGTVLAMPPPEIFDDLDVVLIAASEGRQWSVHCPLWSVDAGRTDLTLELTLIDERRESLRVEIDGIHTL